MATERLVNVTWTVCGWAYAVRVLGGPYSLVHFAATVLPSSLSVVQSVADDTIAEMLQNATTE